MKLLIVDDEPKIRKGLKRHFLECDFGFDLIETADNGIAAMEKARQIKPDIILVDICMPGMDGLDFVERITAELTPAKTIIISGHDDFSYAQRAMRHGVLEYVLKPIDLEQLDSLIKKTRDSILAQRKRQSRVSFALKAMDKSRDVLINDLFVRIINGEIDKDEVETIAAHMGISIPDPAGYMVVKILDKLPQNPAISEFDPLFYAIRNIIDRLCAHLESRIFFIDAKSNLMLLFAYDHKTDYKHLLDEISKDVEDNAGYTVRIDMSVVEGTMNLPEAHRQAMHRLFHTSKFSQIVLDAKAFIEQNYNRENLTLRDVADAIHANPSYLSKLMTKQLGMSFVDYLTGVRMQKAIILLNNSEKDIKLYEISQKIGYSSQHYFSRVFTNHYGISPIQYRMKGVENNA